MKLADVFAGRGYLRARMLEVDWASTPLGSTESWSQSLLTSVSICLSSRFPSAIFWGPELAVLYNEACVPSLGNKHPGALGQPGLLVWPEIRDGIEPLLRRVMDTGEPTSSDLLLRRATMQQGSCFTVTPIHDGSWEVGGVFCSAQPKEDMVAFQHFHRLGSIFFSAPSKIEPLLLEIVDVAMDITGSDFGNIQLVDPGSSDLRIVAQRGFESWWLDFWNTVSVGQGTCGTALERGERVVVEDVERSPIFVGTPALEIQQRAGVKAVISTPLVSRSSKPIGMFSVHFRSPQRFTDETLHRLDLLARHAADIVERAMAEEALRQSEERSRALAEERGQLVERLGEAMRFAEQFVGILGHDLREPAERDQTLC